MITARFSGGNPDHLEQAGSLLRSGGLCAVPTETVYGLAANAMDEQAVKRIFAVKGRPRDNPLIIHIAAKADTEQFCREIPAAAHQLMDAFWPGPLTLVLPGNGTAPRIVTAGLDTVALRCPAHPTAAKLIRHARRALAAPSANVSGKPSATTAEHVLADFDGQIEGVLDGGPCRVGVESTVVDCTGPIPLILRPGGLTIEQLQSIVPETASYLPGENEAPRSPGLRHRHYAPATPLTLLHDDQGQMAPKLRLRGETESLAVLCYDELLPLYEGMRALSYGSLMQPEALAAGLFAALRRLDAMKVSRIYAHCPGGGELYATIRDRLTRAASDGES